MHFTKMQGLGNDYLYVYGEVPNGIAPLCKALSDRHFGAGADGMIFISESDTADYKMRIFNADGSEAEMCGNGIRCVGKYVFEKGYTGRKELTIETLAGIKTLKLAVEDGVVKSVETDMGKVKVSGKRTLKTSFGFVDCIPVSVGNPHAVIFTEDAEAVALPEIGPEIEHHETFPNGTNTEFVQVLGEQRLRMRVWERGSGITLACGTGACASAAAAVAEGFCRADEPIIIKLDGGELQITVGSDGEVYMSGPAEFVYEGETISC